MSRMPIAGCARRPGSTHRRIDWRCLLILILCLAAGCARPCPAAGLRPLPLLMEGLWINPCSIDNMITSEPGSLQPTLRWEAFPRAEDLKADKAGRLATVRDPTYEVRIWRADGDFPAEQVYERSGLGEPVHAIETPLAPGTLYLWTIRARFALDGAPRVTEWGVLLGPRRPDRRTTELPRRGYYRFETPKQ